MDQPKDTCFYRINGGGGPGGRQIDPQTFERATGISCEEIQPDDEAAAGSQPSAFANRPGMDIGSLGLNASAWKDGPLQA